jgi:hypothetical protein
MSLPAGGVKAVVMKLIPESVPEALLAQGAAKARPFLHMTSMPGAVCDRQAFAPAI